jgi:hypothetical protein
MAEFRDTLMMGFCSFVFYLLSFLSCHVSQSALFLACLCEIYVSYDPPIICNKNPLVLEMASTSSFLRAHYYFCHETEITVRVAYGTRVSQGLVFPETISRSNIYTKEESSQDGDDVITNNV